MERLVRSIEAYIDEHRDKMLGLLERLVMIDSGTYDKKGVDRVGEILCNGLLDLDLTLQRVQQSEFGDHLVARNAAIGRPVLLLGHMDTVFESGATNERPFGIKNGRVLGPGVIDMKGGLVVLLYSLQALKSSGSPAWGQLPIVVVLNSDEEIGSPTSRMLIETEAQRAEAAIVLEPGRPNGEFITHRKGMGRYRLTVQGRAAHAGSQPGHGISAIEELAHKILALHKLTDATHDTTVNAGVIRGGLRANVIAPDAWAEIDVRVWDSIEAARVEAAMHEIARRVYVPGARSSLEGNMKFPPWPRDTESIQLFELYRQVAAEFGLEIRETYNGAASDGNYAAQYTAVIDGVGPYGSEEHSLREYMELEGLFERAKILALFLHRWWQRQHVLET